MPMKLDILVAKAGFSFGIIPNFLPFPNSRGVPAASASFPKASTIKFCVFLGKSFTL